MKQRSTNGFPASFRRKEPTLAAWCLIAFGTAAAAVGVAGCTGDSGNGMPSVYEQAVLGARSKAIITVDGYQFRDLNADGKLDPYEDWRLSAEVRAADLAGKMTLDEKAGMMMIDTANSGCGGQVVAGTFTNVESYIKNQNMTRFILRNNITATPVCDPVASVNSMSGGQVSPLEIATYTNKVQELREATRLGIPTLFKSNARNHIDPDARAGINEAAGAFTAFPKEAGLAAAALGAQAEATGTMPTDGDMSIIRSYTGVMAQEWKAIGLRGMYGYMADLSTDPRWYRVHETFTQSADLNANIIRTLVQNLQGQTISEGTSLSPKSAVALTIKHFPGGGPQELGLDPHYSHGKEQVYSNGGANLAYHLKPFQAAIEAGVSSIMPYYGIPTAGRDASGKSIPATYEGVTYPLTGFAFTREIVTGLLRDKLGFKGYVNSDTGIINDRAWGLEGKTVPERVALAINGGTEILSGFHDKQTIVDLVKQGLVSEARVDEAVKRLLKEQFQLGLFENPYVDASKAAGLIGTDASRAVALDIQRKSVVLLQNQDQGAGSKTLPLKAASKVYIIGDFTKANVEKYGYTVTDGNVPVDGKRPSAAGHDYALISVTALANTSVASAAKTKVSAYLSQSDDPTSGGMTFVNPLTGRKWGESDRCMDVTGALYSETRAALQKGIAPLDFTNGWPSCLDNTLMFGGVFPWEASNLAFSAMDASRSWLVKPSLSDIQAIMNEVGAKKVVLAIYFRQPFVLDDASGMKNAGALVAHFAVSDTALLDVLSGKVRPKGRMPFALANNANAIRNKVSDVAGYPAADTLYPFGYGLSW